MYALIDVHKRYGLRTVALRKLNLEIRHREFFVLYGPAGAGKSTILNLIAGLTKPTSGDISRDGVSIAHLPPERRGAAMAFENYALYSHLSVAENLAFPLRAAGLDRSEIESRVKRIASVLGIPHVLDRRPGFLSGGQRQRVALGRAIIRPADIYLLDEPIGHLDAKLRHRMRAELKALAVEMNATVVFTTTSSKEALALGDRVGILNSGRLEQVGTPAELYNSPANTFVASFVGDPPMSFLSVTARRSSDGVKLYNGDGQAIASAPFDVLGRTALKAGLRSNAIQLVDAQTSGALKGSVQVVEHLGHSNIAVIAAGGDSIQVSLPADRRLKPGEPVGMIIDPRQIHLFADERALVGEHV
ncbi:ABC transporter ATP-binding protein [Tabrizicola sp. J26]|uniref:ABC transporter ATP-binding protein n=1 Tax=Alitabrizicola rongguiensis TaxID=2909234 RepID=UPI001F2E6393|nr:ABC transporter ATP-binding protein [Tabrizicola rongguiensis]MCF1711126.1 ABC transporter ATP-binding protein [Tabrizicola rongguiensis]